MPLHLGCFLQEKTLLNVAQSLVTFLSHLLSNGFIVVTVFVGFGACLFVFTSRL